MDVFIAVKIVTKNKSYLPTKQNTPRNRGVFEFVDITLLALYTKSRNKIKKMKKEDVKKIVKYWQKTAEHDFETMLYLFKGKKYSESLFFGHIVLEKILKGLVVKKNQRASAIYS